MSDCIFKKNSHPLWRGDHEPPCRPTISRFDNVTHKVVNERQLLTDSGFVFGASNNNKKKLKFILSLSKKGICPSFFQQFVTDPIVERPYRVIGWLPTPSFLCHFSITAITHISISSLIIFSPQFFFSWPNFLLLLLVHVVIFLLFFSRLLLLLLPVNYKILGMIMEYTTGGWEVA